MTDATPAATLVRTRRTAGLLDLHEWLRSVGGIAHRQAAANAGFAPALQRRAVREGVLRGIRRHWLATADAPLDLVTAAENSGSLSCVSAARRRGWWMPPLDDDSMHLHLNPHGGSPAAGVTAHWTVRLAPPPGYGLLASVEDTLAHLALCLVPEDAVTVWNSAVRIENLAVDALRRVQWPTTRARECAQAVTGLSDSGLETKAVVRLSRWGIPIRQQAVIAGHRVDLLIGERLVVQIDGFAHHSTSSQRTKDVALDAELVLRGYTVLRFTYAQFVYQWESVERTIARAIAAGAHLAR